MRVAQTHDVREGVERLNHTDNYGIEKMVQKIIEQDDYHGLSKYIYIFAHKRELGFDERATIMVSLGLLNLDDAPKARLIWQPRLKKPEAQENSMLFRVNLDSPDAVKIVWILPEKHLFGLYKHGKVFQNEVIGESIHKFLHDKKRLEAPEEGDLNDEDIQKIYSAVACQARIDKKVKSKFQKV